jgi:hypothetical protein
MFSFYISGISFEAKSVLYLIPIHAVPAVVLVGLTGYDSRADTLV